MDWTHFREYIKKRRHKTAHSLSHSLGSLNIKPEKILKGKFLAQPGAQGVTMSAVQLSGTISLPKTIFNLSLSGLSQVRLSFPSALYSYFIGQTNKPKIVSLVQFSNYSVMQATTLLLAPRGAQREVMSCVCASVCAESLNNLKGSITKSLKESLKITH